MSQGLVIFSFASDILKLRCCTAVVAIAGVRLVVPGGQQFQPPTIATVGLPTHFVLFFYPTVSSNSKPLASKKVVRFSTVPEGKVL